MSELDRLERFLRTDPRDVGCDEAMAVLHIYVDLVAAGEDAAGRYPGVAAHLLACGPCGEDFTGLLAAVSQWLARRITREARRAAARCWRSTCTGRWLTRSPSPASSARFSATLTAARRPGSGGSSSWSTRSGSRR